MRKPGRFSSSRIKGGGAGGGGPALPRVTLSVTPESGITYTAPNGTVVATITTDATTLALGGTDAGILNITGMNVVTTVSLADRSSLNFTVLGARVGYSGRTVSLTVPVEGPPPPDPSNPSLTPTGGGYDMFGFGTFPELTAAPADGGYNLETV